MAINVSDALQTKISVNSKGIAACNQCSRTKKEEERKIRRENVCTWIIFYYQSLTRSMNKQHDKVIEEELVIFLPSSMSLPIQSG